MRYHPYFRRYRRHHPVSRSTQFNIANETEVDQEKSLDRQARVPAVSFERSRGSSDWATRGERGGCKNGKRGGSDEYISDSRPPKGTLGAGRAVRVCSEEAKLYESGYGQQPRSTASDQGRSETHVFVERGRQAGRQAGGRPAGRATRE
jgi:hypothetical protein